jgi:hypothetical protein
MKKKTTSRLHIRKSTISHLQMKTVRGGEQDSVGCPPESKYGDSVKYACCAASAFDDCSQKSCYVSCDGEQSCVLFDTVC